MRKEDIFQLQRLGKNHLYSLQLGKDEIHENEAVAIIAESLSGDGISWENNPSEGKINLFSSIDGILKVNTASLASFNMINEVMCATLHNNTIVKKGVRVAATRSIPLIMKRSPIERAAAIACQDGPLLEVRSMRRANAGIVITGDEIYYGLIKDSFVSILTEKIVALGSEVTAVDLAPDNPNVISNIIKAQIEKGCDLILLSGGMSVDPDDVTRHGIRLAGAFKIHYGAAALPGAMFMTAYLDGIPLLGVPGCGLYHKMTVLDLILPRILSGERITSTELAFLGHGGLCMECPACTFPHCPFGK